MAKVAIVTAMAFGIIAVMLAVNKHSSCDPEAYSIDCVLCFILHDGIKGIRQYPVRT